ncbi:Uncharacterised protein [Collinsella intestinalis]|nr:Uncharacterised protein [Collinsella intestinalis]
MVKTALPSPLMEMLHWLPWDRMVLPATGFTTVTSAEKPSEPSTLAALREMVVHSGSETVAIMPPV